MRDDFEITPAVKAYLGVFERSLRERSVRSELERAEAFDVLLASRVGRELTAREREVLVLRCEGLSRREIARRLGLKVRTVEHHFEHVHEKAGTNDPFRLALWALRRGLVDP